MELIKLLEVLEKEKIVIEKNISDKEIKYLSFDSRDIIENTLFFCKGEHYKEEYLISAINKRSSLLCI